MPVQYESNVKFSGKHAIEDRHPFPKNSSARGTAMEIPEDLPLEKAGSSPGLPQPDGPISWIDRLLRFSWLHSVRIFGPRLAFEDF